MDKNDDFLTALFAAKHQSTILVNDKNGNPMGRLNRVLVEKQDISEEAQRKIIRSHVALNKVYDQMSLTANPEKLRRLAKRVTRIEFIQQDLWKFGRDENFHNWYEVPGCKCPKMDNRERKGTKYGIVNCGCPIHGNN